MSKFTRKTTLALALASAFAFTAPLMAATVGPVAPAKPAQVVYYTVAAGAVNTGATTYPVSIEAKDNLVGRTTGMGVRITFPAGVKVTAATAAAAAGIGAGGTPSATVSGLGTNELIVQVTPGAAGLNATAPIFNLSGLTLTGATALGSSGGSLAVTMTMYDPGTAATLATATGTLIQASDAFKATYTAAIDPAKIDVGDSGAGNTNHVSKSVFSTTGAVNGADVAYFQAGTMALSTTATDLDASTGAAYATVAGDKSATSLTGSFGAFVDSNGATAPNPTVTLSSSACNAPTVTATGTVTATKVTFAPMAYAAATSFVCFNAGTTVAIDASSVSASSTFTHGTVTTAAQTGALKALAYNGPVQKVYTFNPGGNSDQQSMLRITNTSATAGKFTITGVDAEGAAGTASLTFVLKANQSTVITSALLENSGTTYNGVALTGGLGDHAGKWRLTVTGEVGSMEVTNLVRNNATHTFGNLGTPVSGDH